MTRTLSLSTSTFVCFGAASTKSTAVACAVKTQSAIASDRRPAFPNTFMISPPRGCIRPWLHGRPFHLALHCRNVFFCCRHSFLLPSATGPFSIVFDARLACSNKAEYVNRSDHLMVFGSHP